MCDRERRRVPQAVCLISDGLSSTNIVPTMISICGRLNRGPKDVHVLMPRTL